jgi:hypothetical protein
MIRRIAAISIAMTFVGFSAVADDIGGEDIVVPPPAAPAAEEPVTLAPPEYIQSGARRSARAMGSVGARGGATTRASETASR